VQNVGCGTNTGEYYYIGSLGSLHFKKFDCVVGRLENQDFPSLQVVRADGPRSSRSIGEDADLVLRRRSHKGTAELSHMAA
jgi:hypothetical protein